jgi:hypothetical protein
MPNKFNNIPKNKKSYVVVRTYSAGVHVGFLESRLGREVVLSEARRIWTWKGAFTLSEVSQLGINEGSRLSMVVPSITLTEAIEIIPTSELAQVNIRSLAEYKP